MRYIKLLLAILCSLSIQAMTYTPETVPFPRANDANAYVADPDHLLSAEDIADINTIAEAIHELAGVEMVTVALDDIGDADAFNFSVELFNRWGIGDKETKTGVLLFFTMQQHDIRITTGSGLEGVLPDATCSQIVWDTIVPYLRAGQYGAGLIAGNLAIYDQLNNQAALEELLLGYRPKAANGQPWKGISICSLILALLALIRYWAAPRCPQCRQKGAKTRDEVLDRATYTSEGLGVHHRTCRTCGHQWDELYRIAKLQRSSSSGGGFGGRSGGGHFGGGSTSGGGAGGKW